MPRCTSHAMNNGLLESFTPVKVRRESVKVSTAGEVRETLTHPLFIKGVSVCLSHGPETLRDLQEILPLKANNLKGSRCTILTPLTT